MILERLQRQLVFLAPAAVMSAWATVMLHTLLAGHINRLLSPMFRSYVGVAAAVLLLLSALHLLLYRPSAERVPGAGRQLGRWLVLLVPILAASVLSPSALSNTTAARRSSGPAGAAAMPTMGAATAQSVQEAGAADPSLPAPMQVTDLVTVSHNPDMIRKFEGRQVHVIGTFAGGSPPRLLRWVMWCCAADAQPASVALTGPLGGPWKEEAWLDVTGVAHFPSTLGQVIPEIEATEVKPTDEPDEPFLSP